MIKIFYFRANYFQFNPPKCYPRKGKIEYYTTLYIFQHRNDEKLTFLITIEAHWRILMIISIRI